MMCVLAFADPQKHDLGQTMRSGDYEVVYRYLGRDGSNEALPEPGQVVAKQRVVAAVADLLDSSVLFSQ